MTDSVLGPYVYFETRGEADAFLRRAKRAGSFDLFSSALKTVTVIRRKEKKKKRLNAADREQLRVLYHGVSTLVHSSPKLFREVVPEREIAAWLGHVGEILEQKINDAHWIRTGDLLEHDDTLLKSFCALLNNPLPAVLTYENTKNLEIISSMIIARKGASGKLPHENFLTSLYLIVSTLTRNGVADFDNTWTLEKVFKKLEATGILQQFLHCATIPTASPEAFRLKRVFLYSVLCSTAFVKKKLKEGTPCGDTVRAILAKGDDPRAICSYTLRSLKSMVKLSTLLQIEDEIACCQYCNKPSLKEAYMRCGRCKEVHYCSKDCQKMDWKLHKRVCVANSKRDEYPILSRLAVKGILRDIYLEIMIRLVQECQKAGGLKMKDMILELDLSPDESGWISLFFEPIQIQIVPITRYLDGTRFAELKGEPGNVKAVPDASPDSFVSMLIDKLSEREYQSHPENLLCFEMHPNIWKFTFQQLIFGHVKLFGITQEAVDAFHAALVDDDFSGLETFFESTEFESSEYVQGVKSRIDEWRDTGRIS